MFASGWDGSDAAKHKVFHKPSYPTLRQILHMEEGKEGDERRAALHVQGDAAHPAEPPEIAHPLSQPYLFGRCSGRYGTFST